MILKYIFLFHWPRPMKIAKDYDRAFEYYAQANDAHRASITYDAVQNELINSNIREVFNPEFFEQHTGGK